MPTSCSQSVPGSSGFKSNASPTAHTVGCTHWPSHWSKPLPLILTPCWELCVQRGREVLHTQQPPPRPPPTRRHYCGNRAPNSNLVWPRDPTSTPADAVIFHSGTLKSLKDDNSSCWFIVSLLCAMSFIRFILNSLNHQTSLISQMWKLRLRENK